MKIHKDGTLPVNGEVFVFGSNLAGRHGAGAAKIAQTNFGAPYGKGWGFYGQSYAIPTKDENIITMDVFTISAYVTPFIDFVANSPEQQFFVTRVGCGLAGYSDSQIAPLFAPLANFDNVSFAEPWLRYVQKMVAGL